MIAVPGVPTVSAGLLDELGDESGQTPSTASVATESGAEFTVAPPDGWQVEQQPNRAVLRSGDAVVVVEAHDRDGRYVAQLAERLLRMDRVRGVSAAFDGGTVATGDGALSGGTCVVTTVDTVGTCAVLSDDDTVLYVQSRGNPDHPAPPVSTILDDLQRTRP